MIKVCVLSKDRYKLLKACINSLKNTNLEYELVILDASKDKQTLDYLAELPYEVIDCKNTTVGGAMNLASQLIKQSDYEYGYITADDYIYRFHWLESLINFWENVNDDIKLCCLNFESVYSWNGIYGISTWKENQYAFLRESLPGSSWSFRKKDIDLIFPVPDKTGGEDLDTCKRLRKHYALACLDLTDHLGEKVSIWGNQSYKHAVDYTRLKVLQHFQYLKYI